MNQDSQQRSDRDKHKITKTNTNILDLVTNIGLKAQNKGVKPEIVSLEILATNNNSNSRLICHIEFK